jgi:hypothetical protein
MNRPIEVDDDVVDVNCQPPVRLPVGCRWHVLVEWPCMVVGGGEEMGVVYG